MTEALAPEDQIRDLTAAVNAVLEACDELQAGTLVNAVWNAAETVRAAVIANVGPDWPNN